MCKFFSFVTEPENHGGKHFYFNWKQRQEDFEDADILNAIQGLGL